MNITSIAIALFLFLAPVARTTAASQQAVTLKFQTVIAADDAIIRTNTPLPSETQITAFKYDNIRHTFDSYENIFIITTTNKVTAKLQKNAELINNQNKKINIDVTLADKLLSTTPVLIHSGTPHEASYQFRVHPKDGIHGDGTYTGDVILIFDVS
jgi:hypothetical protein